MAGLCPARALCTHRWRLSQHFVELAEKFALGSIHIEAHNLVEVIAASRQLTCLFKRNHQEKAPQQLGVVRIDHARELYQSLSFVNSRQLDAEPRGFSGAYETGPVGGIGEMAAIIDGGGVARGWAVFGGRKNDRLKIVEAVREFGQYIDLKLALMPNGAATWPMSRLSGGMRGLVSPLFIRDYYLLLTAYLMVCKRS